MLALSGGRHWAVRLNAGLAALPLFFFAVAQHGVQRRFKGNEEDAWDGACAAALVRSFGGAVRISPRSEHRLLLTVIGDMKLAGYQHHALCRRVPMKREGRLGGHFKEHVDVVFCRVAVKNGDAASFGQDRRAGPPLKLRITGSPRQCLLLNRRLCVSERADEAQQEQQRTTQCRLQ